MLPHLRVLVAEVRKLGEHGIKIMRFKGLGEMDGEELWDTTLDPDTPTLLRVQLRRRPEGRRDVPHADGRESRAAPRVHPEACAGGEGDRLSRGVSSPRRRGAIPPKNFTQRRHNLPHRGAHMSGFDQRRHQVLASLGDAPNLGHGLRESPAISCLLDFLQCRPLFTFDTGVRRLDVDGLLVGFLRRR